jgi:hypothetical protein
MKKIIIKTDIHCGFLRTEAVSKAIEYEETLMKDRKEGIYNSVVWTKYSTQAEYQFVVYHTKTAIIVDVRLQTRKF